MPVEENSRRLHPRLRMLGNGGSNVNKLRADISTTVASARDDITMSLEEWAEDSAGLVLAQESLHYLDAASALPVSGRLPKREKLDDSEPATDAYVNVFVELRPRDDQSGDSEVNDFDALQEAIPELAGHYHGEDHNKLSCSCVKRGRQICVTIPVSKLSELESHESVAFVAPSEALKLDVPTAARSRAPRSRRIDAKKNSHRNGKGVIVGIIDVGGFDFAHADFLDEAGETRFLAIWDQGGQFREAPKQFGYGSEFTRENLNQALKEAAKGQFRPNDLERQSQQNPSSHGTHVASIAAGNSGVCSKADIAAVLIDVPLPEDLRERRRATFSDTSRIIHAVEYLLKIAEREKKPISINISLGTNGGAHDGSSGVSRWLDHALTVPGRGICAAAGNAGQERGVDEDDVGWIMGRIHTSGRVAARGLVTELEWAVVGNGIADISENELEVWYSPQDRFIASVQPPGESRWYRVAPGEYFENKRLSDGTTVSIYNELYHPNNGANYISIYLSPNLDQQNPRGIRAGVWKIRLEGEEVRDGRFHAWIERDDPAEIGRLEGERFFRFPSFFTTRSNVDSHSISSLGCGHNIIGVANLDFARSRINITSSQGPTRDDRLKPDVCAPGTNISAANGFALDDNPWVEMSGTSMASPYVAGVIGLMLATNPELSSAQCAGILQRTSNPLPGETFEWRNDAGFGQIDAAKAIEEALTFTNRKELK